MKNNKILVAAFLGVAMLSLRVAAADALNLHGIFSSNMVLQRDKPIIIWGWAPNGSEVEATASFTEGTATARADSDDGRWQVTFPEQVANAKGQSITISCGEDKITLTNVLIGDVWVMNGQSNMLWPLRKTYDADLEAAQADLPLLRGFRMDSNLSRKLQNDLPESAIAYENGWEVSTPETVIDFSAIGYAFGSRIQRATGIPVGIIDTARGGSSIEAHVPRRKFDETPATKRYAEWVDERADAFDADEWLAKQMKRWEAKVARQRRDGVSEDKLAKKPTIETLRPVHIPGRNPNDASSVYNGMFGVLIGYHFKGVLFHQGYNNAISTYCLPRRYRTLMRLMVEGWREDFANPEMPVAVIGLCAGGNSQHKQNFEELSFAPGAFIREAQRLGLADVGDRERTAFIPAYDVRVPGLHPRKKRDHGVRAARWALSSIYGQSISWERAKLVSAETKNDVMELTFDQKVMPDDRSNLIQGFSIAGEDGKFYMAHARFAYGGKRNKIHDVMDRAYDTRTIHIWSPLVEKPVAVRYAWSRSPMGNLKIHGMHWAPLQSFRTDDWDWPEGEDPAAPIFQRSDAFALRREAKERNVRRLEQETARGAEIRERLEVLGRAKLQ